MPRTVQTSLVGLIHSIRFPASRPRLVASPNSTAKNLYAPRSTLKALNFGLPIIYTRAASKWTFTLGPQGRDYSLPDDIEELGALVGEPSCNVCNDFPASHMPATRIKDSEDTKQYNLKAYCDPCWEKYLAQRKLKAEERLKRSIYDHNVKEMLKKVTSIESTERVPLAYAATKFKEQNRAHKSHNSPTFYKRQLKEHLSKELEIVKIEKQNFCNKARVDCMDFELWRNRTASFRS
jgi:hypothetical protein